MALKFQAPNPKSQIIPNDRSPNHKFNSFGYLVIGIWDLFTLLNILGVCINNQGL
jgi:hypothetical protein